MKQIIQFFAIVILMFTFNTVSAQTDSAGLAKKQKEIEKSEKEIKSIQGKIDKKDRKMERALKRAERKERKKEKNERKLRDAEKKREKLVSDTSRTSFNVIDYKIRAASHKTVPQTEFLYSIKADAADRPRNEA